jgi:8-oxo-dGTP diphosphatase
MSNRAAILLLQDDKVALIERHRAGLHYFTFPGGHVENGETLENAVIRETEEELGLKVVIKKLLASMSWHEQWQYYYLVDAVGGTFGTGSGEEMIAPPLERGTYHPIWMPLTELLNQPVLPREMAELVARCAPDGWPEQPFIISEQK